jgi:hypothetical protein
MHLHFPTIVSESVNVTSFLRMRSLDRIFHCIQIGALVSMHTTHVTKVPTFSQETVVGAS